MLLYVSPIVAEFLLPSPMGRHIKAQASIKRQQRKEKTMTRASYNDIAEWYDHYLQEKPLYAEIILPQLLELVGTIQTEHICDLACGQNWISRELARRGAQVTGLDQAPQ